MKIGLKIVTSDERRKLTHNEGQIDRQKDEAIGIRQKQQQTNLYATEHTDIILYYRENGKQKKHSQSHRYTSNCTVINTICKITKKNNKYLLLTLKKNNESILFYY